MDAPLAGHDRFRPAVCPRLVVKIGSSLLVAGGEVRREWLASVAADVAARRAAGQAVVIVTSGAIALGARRLGLARGGRASLDDAQAAAAAGQIVLAAAYAELLGAHGVQAAQILLTLGDLEDRRRYLNVAATLDRLLVLGAVPVVNENDSVATAEIRFGDNDRLAARVASAAQAGGVILLSDVAGLYTADPGRDPAARLLAEVPAVDAAIEAMAGGTSPVSGGVGTGGMAAKVAAAKIATAAGLPLAIADGRGLAPARRLRRNWPRHGLRRRGRRAGAQGVARGAGDGRGPGLRRRRRGQGAGRGCEPARRRGDARRRRLRPRRRGRDRRPARPRRARARRL